MDQPSAAREVAGELVVDGAEAVVLVGSHARGDAGPDSDVDLLAVGPREFSHRLERRGGSLVSTSSRPLHSYRAELDDPGSVCAAIPAWRDAVGLHDPEGIAASLIEEARAWAWGPLERRCDGWVAEGITSLAEEVHKLISAHRRILYDSENDLWSLVSDAMGEEWRRTQSTALGIGREPLDETCRAALGLYGLAVEEVKGLFDGRQERVVRHALGLAWS